MKRLAAFFAAVLTAVSCGMNVLAADRTVTISSSDGVKPLENTYSTSDKSEHTISIRELLPLLNTSDEGTEKLTIKSESETPVSFKLRLLKGEGGSKSGELPAADTSASQSDGNALDYYNIIITSDGNELYNYKNENPSAAGDTYKDIELFTLNTDAVEDEREYEIKFSVNSGLKSLSDEASMLDLQIISGNYEDNSVDADADGTTGEKQVFAPGTYVTGSDIGAGTYLISGNSRVRIYNTDGEVSKNILLDKSGKNGIKNYVLTLADGEKFELSADTEFAAYNGSKIQTLESVSSDEPNQIPADDEEYDENSSTVDIPVIIGGAAAVAALIISAVVTAKRKRKK